MIGTQLNKSDHFPYLAKNNLALSIFFWLAGNHFLFIKYIDQYPQIQLKTDPSTFPRDAENKSKNELYLFVRRRELK